MFKARDARETWAEDRTVTIEQLRSSTVDLSQWAAEMRLRYAAKLAAAASAPPSSPGSRRRAAGA